MGVGSGWWWWRGGGLSFCPSFYEANNGPGLPACLPAAFILKHSTIAPLHPHTHSLSHHLTPPPLLPSFEIEHFCCYSFYCPVAVGFLWVDKKIYILNPPEFLGFGDHTSKKLLWVCEAGLLNHHLHCCGKWTVRHSQLRLVPLLALIPAELKL